MLEILKQTKEFSSHAIHQIPKFWVQKLKKKTWKISESGGYSQIFLTHHNYEQKNGIQLELFYPSPMVQIIQQTEGGINIIKDCNFEFKNWKKT